MSLRRKPTEREITTSARRYLCFEHLESRLALTSLVTVQSPEIIPPGSCHDYSGDFICMNTEPTLTDQLPFDRPYITPDPFRDNAVQIGQNPAHVAESIGIAFTSKAAFAMDPELDASSAGIAGPLIVEIVDNPWPDQPLGVEIDWQIRIFHTGNRHISPLGDDPDAFTKVEAKLLHAGITTPIFSERHDQVTPQKDGQTHEIHRAGSLTFEAVEDSFQIDLSAFAAIEFTTGTVGYELYMVASMLDVRVGNFVWVPSEQHYQFEYEVIAAKTLPPNDFGPSAQYAVYGISNDVPPINPILLQEIFDRSVGVHGPVIVPPSVLENVPETATRLLVVIDAFSDFSETDELNNATSLPLVDLRPRHLAWDIDNQLIEFQYEVLHVPPKQGVDFALYLSDTEQLDIANPTTSLVHRGNAIEDGGGGAHGVFRPVGTSVASIAAPSMIGDTARYLLLVMDPDQQLEEVDEENNALAIEAFDLAVADLQWQDAAKQISFEVELGPLALPELGELGFYFSSQPTFDPLLPPRRVATRSTGAGPSDSGTMTVAAEELGVPSPGDRYLLLVADPDGQLDELKEENNVQALSLLEVFNDTWNLDENSQAGAVVGQVLTNEQDGPLNLRFEIIAAEPANPFTMDALTGVVTVSDSMLLDREATSEFTLQVRASADGGSAWPSTGTMVVKLNDQDEFNPVANNDAYQTDEDTLLEIDPPALLSNDLRGDATETLTVSAFEGRSTLGAHINLNRFGGFRYDPRTPQLQVIGRGESLVDSFNYELEDGQGSTASATVTVTILGVNDWHNVGNSLDVNNNNSTEPLDALLVINYLNANGPGPLSGRVDTPEYYYDTNDDGQVSPIDVLLIVNKLNDPLSSGEGERSVFMGEFRPESGLPSLHAVKEQMAGQSRVSVVLPIVSQVAWPPRPVDLSQVEATSDHGGPYSVDEGARVVLDMLFADDEVLGDGVDDLLVTELAQLPRQSLLFAKTLRS